MREGTAARRGGTRCSPFCAQRIGRPIRRTAGSDQAQRRPASGRRKNSTVLSEEARRTKLREPSPGQKSPRRDAYGTPQPITAAPLQPAILRALSPQLHARPAMI
ncbi:hypothetical protein CALCODRAFT_155153 [Calocera cornea HHB12733]|uniref:Uncharacterized protein n=1 Tax=Calocera cornea HHB12733 TaxID=1353952 RepID=A0A165CLA3_9BASI|nr:hypothetical protein CALCODRAFT_155153 [Calocera cornea HHB12733]